jgi:hypothetical protein
MKKRILLITAFAGITSLTMTSYKTGPIAGGAGNRTGSGGTTANCSTGGCHAANTGSTTAAVFIAELATPTTPVTSYVPGHAYKVNIGASNTSGALSRFGFQVSCVKASSTNMQEGTFAVGSTPNIALRTSGGLSIMEHTAPIAAIATGIYGVSFDWTAPAAGTGSVKFFGIVNVVNNDNTTGGDQPNVATATITEATTSVGNVKQHIALSAYPSPVANTLQLDIKEAGNKTYAATIFDMAGRTMKTFTVSAGGKASVDVSSFSAGHYTISVAGEQAQGTVHFVKQ